MNREAAAVADPTPSAVLRRPAVGWVLVGLITLLVLLTWAPSLTAGLGDNHEGRILGRHALHVENAQEKGLAGSGWLTDALPYTTSYAHHPPLMPVSYFVTAQLLPVRTDVAMRVLAYLAGVAALPIGAAILRRLGMDWPGVLLATGAVAVTPLFWAYGRLHANVTLLLAMTLVVVRLREDRPIGTGELVAGAVLSFAAVISGYLGLGAAAMLGLWLLAARRLDRVTVVVGTAMAIGAAVTALYVVGGTGTEDLSAQIEFRTAGGDFTLTQWLSRIERWFVELLPWWWRWAVLPAALVAGLADRRTRVLTVVMVLLTVGWVGGVPNGSFVHDYWIFPVLLPGLIGSAALVEYVGRLLGGRGVAGPIAFAIATLLGVTAGLGLLRGPVANLYFRAPEAAGTLVRDVPPVPGQLRAWHLHAIPGPRWLSHYWDLTPGIVGDPDVGHFHPDDVPPVDLVLVRLDRLPDWLPDREVLEPAASEVRGNYGLITGGDLRVLATDP